MNRHLIAVEVSIVGGTDQRMKLNCFAFDQNRLESLDAEPVQRRSTIEQNRMFTNDFIENVPHFRKLSLDHFFRAFDRRHVTALFKLVVDKGLEELERHFLGQTALVQTKLRTYHDDRAAGVIHSLTKEVLAKTSGFSFEHIAERLERPPILAGNRPTA